MPYEVNIFSNKFVELEDQKPFTERFGEYGIQTTFFAIEQYLMLLGFIVLVVLYTISFVFCTRFKETAMRLAIKVSYQSFLEFFAMAVLASLINMTGYTESNYMLFDGISYVSAFLFLVGSAVYVAYLSRTLSKINLEDNG